MLLSRPRTSLLFLGSLVTLGAVSCGGGGDTTTTTSGTTGAGGGTTTAAATTSTTGAGGGSGGAGGSAPNNPLPPAICHAGGTKWKAGTKAFQDSTSKFKLDTLGVLGTRLAAVDFDNDGWPDIVVRKGGNGADDWSDPTKRQTWLLRNKHDGTFEDVTVASNYRKNRTVMDANLGRPGEVVAFGDVDNDGDLDSYTGLSNDKSKPLQTETSEVMLNQGNGTFELGPADSAVRAKPPIYDVPAGASFIDFDRDGLLDLWVSQNSSAGSPQQDRLYKGDGKGGFVDVTVAQGLKTKAWAYSVSGIDALNKGLAHTNAWSAAACDLNGDGNAELLAASYGRAPNHLWQSKGSSGAFGFLNQSVDSGYASDNNQDWTDNESARCWCKLHPSDVDCAGVPGPAITCKVDMDAFRWDHTYDRNAFRLGGNSGTTVCADLNNDGKIDLITSEIAHWDVGQSSDKAEILLNTGEADVHFTRPGIKESGLDRKHINGWNEGIMTAAAFDFDNDGWMDIYLGNSDYPGNFGLLYHQVSPGHFEAVPIADGIDQHRSHGIAVADFDRDGDLDVIVGHSFARCDAECYPTQQVRLFENVMGQDGNAVELTLTGGPSTNRSAIGARVTLTANGVTQTREIEGGHGHYGIQDDLTVHFGMGEACQAEVTVRWPDATLTTQKFNVVSGYRFTVKQGEDPVAVMPAK